QRARRVLHEQGQQSLVRTAAAYEARHLVREFVQPRTGGADSQCSLNSVQATVASQSWILTSLWRTTRAFLPRTISAASATWAKAWRCNACATAGACCGSHTKAPPRTSRPST